MSSLTAHILAFHQCNIGGTEKWSHRSTRTGGFPFTRQAVHRLEARRQKVSIFYDQKVPDILRANLTFRCLRRALVLAYQAPFRFLDP
jgi:hypothetical protein